jgi:hypothetical protein
VPAVHFSGWVVEAGIRSVQLLDDSLEILQAGAIQWRHGRCVQTEFSSPYWCLTRVTTRDSRELSPKVQAHDTVREALCRNRGRITCHKMCTEQLPTGCIGLNHTCMCARSYVRNWCSSLGRLVRSLSLVRGKKAAGSPGRVLPPGFLVGRGSSGDIVLGRGQVLLVLWRLLLLLSVLLPNK